LHTSADSENRSLKKYLSKGIEGNRIGIMDDLFRISEKIQTFGSDFLGSEAVKVFGLKW
jgi:hypothetical protein